MLGWEVGAIRAGSLRTGQSRAMAPSGPALGS